MEIIKGTKQYLGSCQFCSSNKYYIVYEIKGKTTLVRFCNKCLKQAKLEVSKVKNENGRKIKIRNLY